MKARDLRRDAKRLALPLHGELALDKVHAIPRADVEAAVAAVTTSKELASVVVKLCRVVDEQERRIEALERRLDDRH